MSTPRHHSRAQWLAGAASVLGVGAAMLLVSCGGRDADEPTVLPEAPRQVDPGSGPYQCPIVTDEGYHRFTDYAGRTTTYEFAAIQNWEYGAGNGWYTNNPQCTRCSEREKTCDGVPIDVLGWDTNGECDCVRGLSTPYHLPLCFEEPDPVACPSPAALERLAEELDTCWARCRAIQSPVFGEKPLPAERIADGGRCGSRYALHITAGPFDEVSFDFQESWGGIIGAPFPNVLRDAGPYPDEGIEGWDGISFWARRGPESRSTIRLDLTEQHTNLDHVTAEGCSPCNAFQSDDHPEEGCDKFGAHAPLDLDWQFFAIPFSEMRQAGWGKPAEFFDVWDLQTIGFSYNVGFWDFWVDDIALYRVRAE